MLVVQGGGGEAGEGKEAGSVTFVYCKVCGRRGYIANPPAGKLCPHCLTPTLRIATP